MFHRSNWPHLNWQWKTGKGLSWFQRTDSCTCQRVRMFWVCECLDVLFRFSLFPSFGCVLLLVLVFMFFVYIYIFSQFVCQWIARFLKAVANECLSHCIVMCLPKCRGPITCQQGTDNSAADAASAKGLSMTPAMSTVLSPYYRYMRRLHIYPKWSHIPGHLNIIADALSRFQQPLPTPLKQKYFCNVDWKALLEPSPVVIAQTGRKWPSHFGISMQKVEPAVRRLGSSIDFLLGELLAPDGRFSKYLGAV